jgi:hypothetical protein
MFIITRQILQQLFAILRSQGFFAQADWACCNSCGWMEIEILARHQGFDPKEKTIVFCNSSDWSLSFDPDNFFINNLPLNWSGNGTLIVETIRSRGYSIDWDGRSDTLMYLRPK